MKVKNLSLSLSTVNNKIGNRNSETQPVKERCFSNKIYSFNHQSSIIIQIKVNIFTETIYIVQKFSPSDGV